MVYVGVDFGRRDGVKRVSEVLVFEGSFFSSRNWETLLDMIGFFVVFDLSSL